MLTVGKLIDYLSKFDKDAKVCYGEDNMAMLGAKGYWQQMSTMQLPMLIRTVKEDKENLMKREKQLGKENVKRYLDDDYIYVDDNDIIITI